MQELAKAVIEVTKEVKGVEKNTNVGTGGNSYKGVSDKDVKEVLRKSMAKNGLSILPIGVETETKVDRWEEDTGKWGIKRKQSVFTEAHTKYLLLHTSGESVELMGYGHGVDTQDKSAGKATTYALKYTLLYTFLVPTGEIDDADVQHSDEHEPAPAKAKPAAKKEPEPTQPALDAIAAATSLDELKTVWTKLTAGQKKDAEVVALKEQRKGELSETSNQ